MTGKSQELALHIGSFGGMNNADHPRRIEDNQFRYLENLVPTKYGGLTIRPGLYYRDDDSHGPENVANGQWFPIGRAESNIANVAELFASFNDKLYTSKDGGETWIKKQHAAADMTDNSQFLTNDADGSYWLCNQGLMQWDGNATTLLKSSGVPTTMDFVEYFKNRLFAWEVSSSTNTIHMSEIGDYTTWTDSLDIALEESRDNITKVIAFKNLLYAFSLFETWAIDVTGEPQDWVVTNVSKTIGAAGPSAIVESEGILYVRDRNGFFAFDGFNFTKLSEAIDPYFNGNSSISGGSGGSDRAFIGDSVAVYRDWFLLINNSTNTSPYVVPRPHMIYHKITGTWSVFASADVNRMQGVAGSALGHEPRGSITDPGGFFVPYKFNNLDQRAVFTRWDMLDSFDPIESTSTPSAPSWSTYFQDIDTDFDCILETKEFDLGSPIHIKRVKKVLLEIYSDLDAELTYIWTIDGTDQASLTMTPGASDRKGLLRPFQAPGPCRTFQFRMSFTPDTATTKDSPFFINGLTFLYHMKKELISS